MAAFADAHQREAEQDGEQQHLNDVADLEYLAGARPAQPGVGRTDEGADDAVGDDVQHIFDRRQFAGRLDVAFDRRRLRLAQRFCGEAGARLPEQADDDAEQ